MELVLDKYQNSGTTDLFEIPDFYTYSDLNFVPSTASVDGGDCDAMYFYAYNDLLMTNPWTDSDITLSAADSMGVEYSGILPVQTSLTH